MAGAMLPPVLGRLQSTPSTASELDGSFQNHEPNPLLPENHEFVMAKVLKEKAVLGAAFDGDADRCFLSTTKASSCRATMTACSPS